MAILKYIGRRLLVLIPVLLGISLAAFLLGRIAPGDPVDDALFRVGIEFPTEEGRAAMRSGWIWAAPTSATRTSPRS